MENSSSYPHQASCRFRVTAWDEHVVVDEDADETARGKVYYPSRGLTSAEASYAYTGELEGRSVVHYLIASTPEGPGPVVGMERFEGALGGRRGSMTMQHVGSQEAGGVAARLQVVPGMGTGDLAGVRGEAELLIAGHSDDGYDLVLHYSLR